MITATRLAREAFEQAVGLDQRGRENDAIALYRRAIRLGLKGKPLRDAMIGLGSSLSTVGQHRSAMRILDQARKTFREEREPTSRCG
jgi:TolA-binding protein